MTTTVSNLIISEKGKEESTNDVTIANTPFVIDSNIIIPCYTDADLVYLTRKFYEYDPSKHVMQNFNHIKSSNVLNGPCIFNSKINSILSVGGVSKTRDISIKHLLKNKEWQDFYEETKHEVQSVKPELTVFNLKNNVYNKFMLKNNDGNLIYTGCKMEMTDNKIHIFSGNKHFIYIYNNLDINVNKPTLSLLKMNEIPFDTHSLRDGAFLYCKLKNSFIIFGGHGDSCQMLLNYNEDFYEYNISNNKCTTIARYATPINMRRFGYVLYEDRFIITFGGVSGGFLDINDDPVLDLLMQRGYEKEIQDYIEEVAASVGWKNDLNDIWILDLWNEHSCWIKSSLKCPIKGMCFAVLQNNFVHVFERLHFGYCRIKIDTLITSDLFDEKVRNLAWQNLLDLKIIRNNEKQFVLEHWIKYGKNIKYCSVCHCKCYKKCSRCKSRYYCSRKHQKIHWKNKHRLYCQ